MKKQQKHRRSFALIGALLLCIVTVLALPIGAATVVDELPVRYAIHLHIDLEDLATHVGGDPDVQLVPADDSGIPPEYTDPESPDYGNLPEEYAGWNGIFRNAVVAVTRADGSLYMEQSSYWYVTAYDDGSGDGYYMDFTCDDYDMSQVALLWYFPDEESVFIGADRDGGSGYTAVDIYLEPQFTESPLDSFAALDTRDLSYVTWLAGWGFEVEIQAYSEVDIPAIKSEAYSEGKIVGYDEGYAAAESQYIDDYDEGYSQGFFDGQTDAMNSTNAFKKVVFAIFGAPVELINGVLDFELFGINLAALVRTVLTLSVVGIIVFFIFKLTKGG